MSPLLAPVLAQLITLGVGDRTEARAIYSEGTRTTEGSTSPFVGLNAQWRYFGIGAAYYPSLTLRPLDKEPRALEVTHGANLGAAYHQRFQRTALTVSEAASYTQSNLHENALAPPPAFPNSNPNAGGTGGMGGTGGTSGMGGTGGTSGMGGTGGTSGMGGQANQPNAPGVEPELTGRAFDRVVRFGSLTTTVRLEQFVSSTTSVGGELSHTVSSGLDDSTRADYPLVMSESGLVFATHRLTRRDDVDASFVVQHARAPDDTVGWVSLLSATYHHRFAPLTNGHVGAGVASTLTQLPSDIDIVSIYPTFDTGITHATRVGRGMLSMHAEAASGPVLDLTTALVDPRVGIGAGVGWTLEALSMYANGTSALSLNGDADAFNNITGTAGIAYALGAGFSVDTGVRAAWQTLGGTTLVPPSWAVFIGISWGAGIPLHRNH
jgi:hypothetical protein